MPWQVIFDDDFVEEYEMLPHDLRLAILSGARLLSEYGPGLGCPYVDTLRGSAFPNMKELRLRSTDGAWRIAFAFDPRRQAVLLIAGNKAGKSQKRFYTRLITIVDARFTDHLARTSLRE
ncbi:type II toxin-antitoxin system RelE/ParE family toxin [Tistrella mobilis]|uniref:type II toxin-antitoxin system RelE/ParE family toxin n=1 Tax=Tistrella mobilis TaxID=171437 RepID=UPI0035591866